MTDRDSLPIVDMASPAFWSDMHTPLAEALERSPVARTPAGGLLILGAEEAERFLRDPTNLTVDLLARGGITDGPLHDWWSQVMFSTDPPEHTRLRSLVSRAFTPRQAEQMRGRVADLTDELLAPHLDSGTIDLVDDFAHHLPIRVMGALLAVPDDDYDTFAHHTAQLGLVFSSMLDPGLRASLEVTVEEFGDYVRGLIASRRAHPGDDLLSQLIAAEDAGDRLSEDELVALVMNLLFAGHDTTRSLLQIGLALLVGRPDIVERLDAEPDFAGPVVDEVLRFDPAVFGSARQPSAHSMVGGIDVSAGEPVSIVIPAANRDPRRYGHPHDFDPDRWRSDVPPAASLAFGQGAHYCLGAALARVEAQVALPRVLGALTGLTLAAPPVWVPYASIRRFERLPATFSPD